MGMMHLLKVFLGDPFGPDLTKLLGPAGIGYVSALEENPFHQQTPLAMHRGQVMVGFLAGNTGVLRLCVDEREKEKREMVVLILPC